MKNEFKYSILSMLCSAFMLLSCQLDPFEIPSEEFYTRAFIKKYGLMDKTHDWNMVSCGEVTVNVDRSSSVKVLATIGGKSYILANYINVQGSRTLTFDMPKGVTDITVCSGAVSVKTKVGASVDLSGDISRAFIEQEISDPNVLTRSLAAEENRWMVIPWLNATIFRRKMVEGYYNADREGVSPDFMFRNDAPKPVTFVIRPLYWDTSRTHNLGIFYYNEAGDKVHVPIWKMDKVSEYSDDLLYAIANAKVKYVEVAVSDTTISKYLEKYHVDLSKLSALDNFSKACSGIDDHNVTFACREYLQKVLPELPGRTDGKKFNYVYRWKFREEGSKLLIVYTYFNYNIKRGPGGGNFPWGQWPTPDNNVPSNDIPNESDEYEAVVSKGIEVTVQPGLVYGFYIEDATDASKRYYSSRKENAPTPGWYPVGERGEDGHYAKFEKKGYASYAATWMATKYENWRYLSFEDWDANESDFTSEMKDLNDLVFIIEDGAPASTLVDIEHGDKVKPIPETYSWILAAEDLGNMDDFDFNDLVIGITPDTVDASTGKKKLKIKALASGGTLPLQLMRMDETGGKELISGEFHTWFGNGNISSATMINTGSGPNLDGKVVTIEVPENFTLAKNQRAEGGNMGGFTIEVTRQNGKRDSIVAPDRENDAPQMICVSGGWGWPNERVDISTAYLLFEKWIGDKEVDWFVENQFVPGKLFKQPVFNTDSVGGGSSETPDPPAPQEKVASITYERDIWNGKSYKLVIPIAWLTVGTTLIFEGSDWLEFYSKFNNYMVFSDDDNITKVRSTSWVITEDELQKIQTEGDNYVFYCVDYARTLTKIIVETK